MLKSSAANLDYIEARDLLILSNLKLDEESKGSFLRILLARSKTSKRKKKKTKPPCVNQTPLIAYRTSIFASRTSVETPCIYS